MISGDAKALREGCSILPTHLLSDEKIVRVGTSQWHVSFTIVPEGLVVDLKSSLEIFTLRHCGKVASSIRQW